MQARDRQGEAGGEPPATPPCKVNYRSIVHYRTVIGGFQLNTKTNCLTSAELQAGQKYQTTLVFSHEEVARYCDLSGDRNAIHANVEAAQLRFPGVKDIIVPGGLIQIAITGIFGTQFPGDGSLGLIFTPERMRRPVCPGEAVHVTIEVTKIRGDLVELEVTMNNAEGAAIGGASTRLLAPDPAYQQWWKSRQGNA